METIAIISLIAVLATLAVNVFLVIKIPKDSSITAKDYFELREFIQKCFKEQESLNEKINNLMISSVVKNNDSVINTITKNSSLEFQRLDEMLNRLTKILDSNDKNMQNATTVLQEGLIRLQNDNEKKLEQMRQTVDEKLNVSLERRLGESFKIINERLQSVYEGLGEMKSLASGVGDLKRVLTNVKTRGTWGEYQLGNLLEQIMAPEQYEAQVAIRPTSQERVDYVIKLPEGAVLPIDAKFPIEDYQRLCEASERGDIAEIENSIKALEKRIKEEAKSIRDKYIDVPKTTDFAIMYLSIEGLYAEVLKRTGLIEELQRDYKVTVCGPTTLASLLNSLQMGFRTLTIQKRSSEVWSLLGAVKQEFGKFVDLLAKTQKKLNEVSNTIDNATRKSRTIERKLKNISIESGEEQILELNDEENLDASEGEDE